MMKAESKTDGGMTPHHYYFWITTLIDGSVIPEYDFDNSKHNKVKELPIEFVIRFSWFPVTQTLIERAKACFNEFLDVPLSPQIHTINISVNEGERLRVHPIWRNDIIFLGAHKIETMYALFKTKKDGTIEGFWIDKDGNVIKE